MLLNLRSFAARLPVGGGVAALVVVPEAAGILPVLAQQPVDEGGLAYAGGTYEGNCLSLGDIRQYLVIAVQRHGRSDKYICPDSDAGGLGGLYCGIIAKVGTTTGREPLSHATDK